MQFSDSLLSLVLSLSFPQISSPLIYTLSPSECILSMATTATPNARPLPLHFSQVTQLLIPGIQPVVETE